MKKISLLLSVVLLATACVSKKEFIALEQEKASQEEEMRAVRDNLAKCLVENEKNEEKFAFMELKVKDLESDKKRTLEYVDNLTVLTKGANENIKETLNQLGKKDQYINRIRAAASKKDSLNLVVAFKLKRELKDGIDDEDIQIDIEKTVVFISISDKLLFKSGSYNVSDEAFSVLEKVATVIKGQPEMDVMIEGHTDANPIKTQNLQDNWDLSALRATSVTRVLQYKFGVKPARLIAAGRSSYIPLAPNDTDDNRSKNRRTKIIIMPKLGQFFDLLEDKTTAE